MRAIVVVLICVSVAACGSSSPSAPSRTTSSIDVVVPEALKVGETGAATGSERFSDGTSSPVTTGWRSDNASVAVVSDAGVITGVASGQATIFVVVNGRQGQQVVTVVPDFSGEWAGTFAIAACQISGAWTCGGTTVGLVVNMTASFAQTGRRVSGQISFGSRVTAVDQAAVGNDGLLLFTAVFTTTASDVVTTVTRMLSPTQGQIVAGGPMVHRWTNPGTSGERIITANMSSLGRR